VGLFGPPDVERYARMGHIDKLTEAARSKRWPEAAIAARRALEERMDLLIDTLGTGNLRRVLTAREALRVIGRPATRALLEKIDDPRRERRQDVVHALGEVRDPYAVKALVGRLRDPDGLVRQLTCRALAKIGDPRALGPLRRAAAADPDTSVRKTAAEAARRIEQRSDVAARRAAAAAGGAPAAGEPAPREDEAGEDRADAEEDEEDSASEEEDERDGETGEDAEDEEDRS
jgi:HEAT repeat protein